MTKSEKRHIFVLAEQLVQTWLRNDASIAELEELRRKRARVHAYMRESGFNSQLAASYLGAVHEARRDHLARLREGRRKALVLLARASKHSSPRHRR